MRGGCFSFLFYSILFFLFLKFLAIPLLLICFICWIIKIAFRVFNYQGYNRDGFIRTTFYLLGYIGVRSSSDTNLQYIIIDNVIEELHLTSDNASYARQCVEEGRRCSEAEMERIIQDCKNDWKTESKLQNILKFVSSMLFSDNKLTREEVSLFSLVAKWFGIPSETMKRSLKELLRDNGFVYDEKNEWFYQNQSSSNYYQRYYNQQDNQYGNDSNQNSYSSNNGSSISQLDKAYKILGINASTSDADAKKAYKKMMLRYHPDRAYAKGLGDEGVKQYTELSQQIQEAWGIIKSYRHIS